MMSQFSETSIDEVRNYWNERPCNVKHSDKLIGSKEYFEDVERKKFFVEPHLPNFADYSKYRGKKVLEIGCGIGTDSINFAKAGADLHVVELSKNSLDICKERFKVYGLKAKFYEGSVEELSSFLPLQEFDLVYSWGVIHHTPNPHIALKELTKYLKVGGELKLMVYSKVSYKLFRVMKETNQWDFSNIDKLMANYSEAQIGCPVTYTYTFDEIENLLGAQYEIVDIHKDHIFPYKVDKYVRHEYELEDCFSNIDPNEFDKLKKELGWHTLVRAIKL